MLDYFDTGCFDSEVIVFIHGLGSHKKVWTPQLELGFKYRLLIPDLRGHGLTEMNDDITIENMAKDVIELLDQQDIESAYICGLSLGGIVAQEIYKQAPDKVKGLILANTASYIDPIMASSVVLYAYQHHKDTDFIDKVADRGVYKKEYLEEAKEAFMVRKGYMKAATAAIGHNYFPVLMNVTCPVYLIGGDKDRVTPALNQLFMKAACVNARFVDRIILTNTGHLSNIESAKEFNRVIDQFIEEASHGK